MVLEVPDHCKQRRSKAEHYQFRMHCLQDEILEEVLCSSANAA